MLLHVPVFPNIIMEFFFGRIFVESSKNSYAIHSNYLSYYDIVSLDSIEYPLEIFELSSATER